MKKKLSVFLKNSFRFLLKFLNRLAPYLEIIILYFTIEYFAKTSGKEYAFFLYFLPIFLLYRLLKWEFRCIKSRAIIKNTARSKRVQGFSGAQGAGKTSFMLFSLYCIKPTSIFTNFPCKVRGKFSNELSSPVLNLSEKIPDGSACALSEVTMLFHNIVSNTKNDVEVEALYSQQLHQQIIRHIYDGNLFYDSVDLTRLPQMLKDNISMTNYLLGQGNVTLSFLISPLLSIVGKRFGVDISGNIRYWDVQQLEKIPEQGYTFDLSTQTKDTSDNHFSNLLRLCTWDSLQRFDYDDRFLRGLYALLPDHMCKEWSCLEFAEKDLRNIGYGHLLDFFKNKIKNGRNIKSAKK